MGKIFAPSVRNRKFPEPQEVLCTLGVFCPEFAKVTLLITHNAPHRNTTIYRIGAEHYINIHCPVCVLQEGRFALMQCFCLS